MSTHVAGDPYRGADSADRMAEFASEGSPQAVESALLSAYSCGVPDAGGFAVRCPSGGPATQAAKGFAGAGGSVYARRILVRHASGQLALMTLYVAHKPGGGSELIDSTGQSYPGGLQDFRSHNHLLSAGDQILTLQDVTAIPGRGAIVVVPGHTPAPAGPWIAAGIVLAVLIAAAGAFLLIRTRRARATPVPAGFPGGFPAGGGNLPGD
ncbi:MAG TPA: hypothetical protein VGM53_22780 [Streptosporangiaceae bacterium]